MLRLQPLACIAALALAAGTAQANPYSLQVLRTRAVPGPHVQITYGVDWAGGRPLETPTLAATFGTKQTPWVTVTGSYSSNTGSGVVPLQALQCCDCFVPKGGPLTYQTTVTDLTYPGGTVGTVTLSSTVTPSDSFDAAAPVDSGPIPDGAAWMIPDPVGVQGVDCTTVCLAFSPDASIVAPDAPITTPDASPTSADVLIATFDALTIAPDTWVVPADTPRATVDTPPTTVDASTAAVDASIASFDVPVATVDVPVATAPDARTTIASGSKGCSFGGTGSASGLSLVAVLALLGLRRRRGS